jgi:hypothetical protein
MSDDEVRAKVAGIVTETQVAFNAGIDAGVRDGDLAQIIKVVEITDPDSGDLLGTVRIVRLNLKIHHVQQKLSVGLVTDYETLNNVLRITAGQQRKRKTVTLEKFPSMPESVVKISLGETAVISRPEEIDDPPF